MAFGPNLVVNGDFPTDVASWNKIQSPGSSLTHTATGGGRCHMAITVIPPSVPVSTIWINQAISVVAFTAYRAIFDVKTVPNPGNNSSATLGVGTTNQGFEHGSVGSYTTTGLKTFFFTTGAETTVYMVAFLGGGSSEGGFADQTELDDITLQVLFDPFFLPIINIIES